MDALRALIRSHRPNSAAAYYLQGHAGRYPKTGGWALDPFVPPVCPSGSYTLAFLASETHNVPLPPAMHGMAHPVIQVPEQAKLAEQARAAAEARIAALEAELAALRSEKRPSAKKQPGLHRKHKLTRPSR